MDFINTNKDFFNIHVHSNQYRHCSAICELHGNTSPNNPKSPLESFTKIQTSSAIYTPAIVPIVLKTQTIKSNSIVGRYLVVYVR